MSQYISLNIVHFPAENNPYWNIRLFDKTDGSGRGDLKKLEGFCMIIERRSKEEWHDGAEGGTDGESGGENGEAGGDLPAF